MAETRTEYQTAYKRSRRLRGRLCETCGKRSAIQYHRAHESTRPIVICDVCAGLLGVEISP